MSISTKSKKVLNSYASEMNLDASETAKLTQDFIVYIAEAGWEDWMNAYTEAEDDESVSEEEIEAIEIVQAEKFCNKHLSSLGA